jgi:hypothetical protein
MNYLLEIKREKGKLTQDQVSFHDEWKGTIFTVRSIEEALQTLGLIS